MWLYITIGVVIASYLLFTNKRTCCFWDHFEVPSISGSFLIGSIWEVMFMKKHMGLLAQEWYRKYSHLSYFGYYNCSTPVLMIRDVDIIKDVLIKDFNCFSTNEFHLSEDVDPLLASNPFMISGEKWKRNRSIMSQLFTSSRIKIVFPLMKTSCVKLEDYLNKYGSEDHHSRELAAKFTTENSIMCGFTFNAESFTNPDAEFRTLGRKLFEQTPLTALKFTINIFLPWLSKLLRIPLLPTQVDRFFRKFIKSNIGSRKNAPADDFLQALLENSENQKLSDNELIGHALTFFVEGFETSSAILSYGMFELSRNPDIQKKIYDEVTNVLADFNDDLSYDALQQMEYLDAFVNETMRMHPVLLTMNKICTVPYEFRPLPGKTTGYKMPKGGVITIPIYAVHHDPEYFEEPEVFKPDRFLPEQRKTIKKGAFLGFGEGPRMCVGMRFGHTQIKVALATIVKSFCIKLSPTTKPYSIDPGFFMNAPLNPILLNFEKR